MTEPHPRMPAATAPCSASGAAASVMRLAATLGTSPCSAIATSVASSTRRWAAPGICPVISSHTWSVKVMVPTSSLQRSCPRTTIVSALDAEIAVLRCACEPIFMDYPSRARCFRIAKLSSFTEAARRC